MRSCALVTALAVVCTAGASPPTNERLFSSLPDSIESVMACSSRLRAEDCALKSELERFLGAGEHAGNLLGWKDGEDDIVVITLRGLVQVEPRRRVIGGGGFVGLRDRSGSGQMRSYIEIWVTAESNAAVTELLERRVDAGDAHREQRDGLVVYSEEISSTTVGDRRVFVAFPTDRIAVIGVRAEDIETVAEGLNDEDARLPDRWKDAAVGLDLESPFVLLRKFADPQQSTPGPDADQPGGIARQRVPIDSFGLTSDAGEEVRFRLRIVSPRPEDAAHYFYGGTFHRGFPPQQWKWDAATDEKGTLADIDFAPRQRRNHYASLIVITLWGMQLGI